jgi:ppGpp synthetase/RelA/SpoT-type nucleotidyltranferase
MLEKKKPTPSEHKEQIEKYIRVFSCYEKCANVLKRVLENACKPFFPDAFVQSRPKSISSFAEKAVRKYKKYPDAVNQMTDLCGARVIVQTTEQVEAVKLFIKANFLIVEEDEKGMLLGEDKFGYRDLHFIVQLRPNGIDALNITLDDRKSIGDYKAEIQVRTWLQHAWADTLHDRLYKNPLKLSSENKRAGNLLAALMEEGDRNYNSLAHELDGMIANYTAFAAREDVLKEIEVQKLILDNEPDNSKKPALALKLGRLLGSCGDFARVEQELGNYQNMQGVNRCEILQNLGFAICKIHRKKPDSKEYENGINMLKEAVSLCNVSDLSFVPHLRNRESLHARALFRLAWASEAIRRMESDARDYYHYANEHEPGNPYYLAAMLGFEIYSSRDYTLSNAIRTLLREAIKTCRSHALAGIELPHAYFTAGRFFMLLDEPYDALGYYARGIRHCLAGTHCVPSDALDCEIEWVEKLHAGIKSPDHHRWVLELLALAKMMEQKTGNTENVTPKALILSGGAASLDTSLLGSLRVMLKEVLTSFKGIVISGGTTAGVPGCAGDVAGLLATRKVKGFELIGYIPKRLPHDAEKDKRYDHIIICGESGFTPDQVLQSWRDLLAKGIVAHEILCIGFGGGKLSAVEYQVALALGASVVVAYGLGGAADSIASDALWSGVHTLMPLPMDKATFQALLTPGRSDLDQTKVIEMAQEFHIRYVAGSAKRLPANMRPWPKLEETYRKANLEQAKYAVIILEKCGFGTRPSEKPVIFTGFTNEDIERMAEMEHGRWNVERLRDGWRPGKSRDDVLKIHDCLVPWALLSDDIRHYDRDAVRAFPEILAKVGLEVYRLAKTSGKDKV